MKWISQQLSWGNNDRKVVYRWVLNLVYGHCIENLVALKDETSIKTLKTYIFLSKRCFDQLKLCCAHISFALFFMVLTFDDRLTFVRLIFNFYLVNGILIRNRLGFFLFDSNLVIKSTNYQSLVSLRFFISMQHICDAMTLIWLLGTID